MAAPARERHRVSRRGVAARLDALDWDAVGDALDRVGYAVTPPILDAGECAALVRMYGDDRRFRSTVDMGRHRFGEGEYRYFAEPLPALIAELRVRFFARLAPLANHWMEALGAAERFPPDLAGWLARCAAKGQQRPTPLLLRYVAGGFNCLHQDIYGALAFPLQVTIALSQPGKDYDGGEFLLAEQRPRAQSRGEAIVLERGAAVIFPNRHRPVSGARGSYRVTVRHGVSRIRSGERLALGVIFHDAE
jgi:hypothetical protein